MWQLKIIWNKFQTIWHPQLANVFNDCAFVKFLKHQFDLLIEKNEYKTSVSNLVFHD